LVILIFQTCFNQFFEYPKLIILRGVWKWLFIETKLFWQVVVILFNGQFFIGWKRQGIASLLFAMLFVFPAHALTDEEIKRGFNLTVFGSEIAPLGFQARYIHKFNGVVKFRIHNLSSKNRTRAIRRFIGTLENQISGLKVRIVNDGEAANFNIYVVNRSNYIQTVREKIEKRRTANVPGKCLVKSKFSRAGMIHSDAVIVSDEGEALFRRCLIEEILQGLGPLNESTSLDKSVFNDTSKHTRFTDFDRLILNMLYDPRIKNGASIRSVSRVLDDVLKDTRVRLGL
jgi:hypothetical protein